MSSPTEDPTPGEPMGPQRAAQSVLEVDAQPFDRDAPPGAGAPDPLAAWRTSIKGSVAFVTGVLARKWPFWAVEQAESDAFADAWAPVLEEWFPGGMPPWAIALGVTGMVFGPRVLLTFEAVKLERERAARGEQPPASTSSAAASGEPHRDRGTSYPDRADPQPRA